MPDARAWAREARLLIVLVAGTRDASQSDIEDVLAVDFLLQHPSLLGPFVELADEEWQLGSLPSASEAESSEEALLRWKRVVGARVVAPMLGRIIARGLATHRPNGTLHGTSLGVVMAAEMSGRIDPERVRRAQRTAAIFRHDPFAAHERLRFVLAEAAV
jgi:hypothetical protein